ncbi:MAG: enoyl-CoA hydratase/isomerase family protein [Pyrinomonadaceae bacterium]
MIESEIHPILAERHGYSLVIRFIRPNARNPLSISVLKLLQRIIDNESKNPEFKKIIFTGAADVFASGADLREIASVTKDAARKFALRGQTLMKKITDAPQTTFAAINGYCFGGALDLALACKVRIASPNAVFCHPGANLGIMTGWGGTQRLPRLIGEARALEMFLTAKKVDAREALKFGLIDEIAENPLAAALQTEK